MLIELLHKEYKENFSTSDKPFKKVMKIIGGIIGLALLIALEVFIFFRLDAKLTQFSKYGSLDFLILFLVILLCVSIISSVIKGRGIFYKKVDSAITLRLPLDYDSVIASKTIIIYLNNLFLNIIISLPLLITYGVIQGMKTTVIPQYYVLCILYPIIISFFSCGVVLLILPLYNKIYNFLKKYFSLQIIVASILVIGLCFLYQQVLNLFVNLLNDAQFDSIISEGFINTLREIIVYFFPVSGLVNVINFNNSTSNLLISLGVVLGTLIIGFFANGAFYNRYLKKEFSSDHKNTKSKKRAGFCKVLPLKKALLRKEFVLLFRNSNYIFSYTSLLVMQPFLAFAVISSLNKLMYSNMQMLLVYFPELINGINVVLLLLFSSVILSSALDYYSREESCLKVVKTIPIDPYLMSKIKLIIPTVFSVFSFVLTLLVLLIAKEITVLCFFITLIEGLLIQGCLSLGGLYIDLYKLDDSSNKNISFLSTVISLVLPLTIFALHVLMMYFGVSSALIYISQILLIGILFVVLLISFNKVVSKKFIKMRVN